ncbi:MAG TPA: helix-turn-helix domain-containing protein, partial [Desulfuromonadales bacterium]|nr:helix-turn-helix domain-containing protein [Desulfuromonadales bacterium]
YYRLNVIPIVLPPLRDRREDIALLARHFLQKSCKEMNRTEMTLSPGAIFALEEYGWPGNVREMENVIERTVALTDGDTITPRDLPPNIGGSDHITEPGPLSTPHLTEKGLDMPRAVNEIESRLIIEALEMTGGVKARAASLLGINRTTLVEKIKRLGLVPRD